MCARRPRYQTGGAAFARRVICLSLGQVGDYTQDMSITFNMVIDELLASKMVFFPLDCSVRFEAVAGPSLLMQGFEATDILFLCADQQECLRTLQGNPDLHSVCVLEEDETTLEELVTTGRCLGIRSELGLGHVLQQVQSLLQRTQSWVMRLQSLVLEGCSYSDLLDESVGVFGCPMVMSGVGLQIVAYTSALLPDEPVVRGAIERGYFDEEAVAHFREEGLTAMWEQIDGLTLVEKTTSQRDYPIVFYVFRVDDNYYLHLTVHLRNISYNEGFRDRLQILVDIIERHVSHNPPSRSFFEDSASAALSNCVQGNARIGSRTLQAFKTMGFDKTTRFRLWTIDYGLMPGEAQVAVSLALELVGLARVGVILAVADTKVVVLESMHMRALSIADALSSHLSQHDAVTVYSDCLSDLDSLPFAYQQCCAGIEASSLFNYERKACYSFTCCFRDYLLLRGANNIEFVEECSQRGIVGIIRERDRAEGTQDAEMLRTYIASERRTQLAAEKLFVHRNTLAYRMQRLEESLGISLDDASTRWRIEAEFRILDRLEG